MDGPSLARSPFVTAVAWAFILLGGFAALVCLLQSIMIAVMFPHGVMQQIGTQADAHVRDFARLVLGHLQLIFIGLLLVFVTTVAAAIGLLRRSNAARVAFVGLMGLGVVWNVASAVLIYYFLPMMPDVPAMPPSPLPWPFGIVRNIAFVFGLTLSIACIGLFWWLARHLTSEAIRHEFVEQNRDADAISIARTRLPP